MIFWLWVRMRIWFRVWLINRLGIRLRIRLVDRLMIFWLWVRMRIWFRVWLIDRLGIRLWVWLVHGVVELGLWDRFSNRLRMRFRNRTRIDRRRIRWWGGRVVRWRWWTIWISISSHDLMHPRVLLELVHRDSVLHTKHRLGIRQTKG